MKIVVVGFSIKEENSVFYQKKDVLITDVSPDSDVNALATANEFRKVAGDLLLKAWPKNWDFVIVRFID